MRVSEICSSLHIIWHLVSVEGSSQKCNSNWVTTAIVKKHLANLIQFPDTLAELGKSFQEGWHDQL